MADREVSTPATRAATLKILGKSGMTDASEREMQKLAEEAEAARKLRDKDISATQKRNSELSDVPLKGRRKGMKGGGRVGAARKKANRRLATSRGRVPKGGDWKALSNQTEAERWGRQVGEKKYSKEKRVQKSLGQPARAIRKGTTWVKEQYGDARDSVKGLLTGDPEHGEFRKGQQARRRKHLGYKAGGYVEKLKRGGK